MGYPLWLVDIVIAPFTKYAREKNTQANIQMNALVK